MPAAQLENPREFQLGQIRRRFNPTEKAEPQGSSYVFKLSPSDPDFPYEIEALECQIYAPRDYPEASKPKLRILNKDIPRGFQINLEQGFEEIATTASNATLLGLMNRLDKALAELLSRPMAETIKLYRPTGSDQKPAKEAPKDVPIAASSAPSWSESDKANALAKRQADIRQLNARLGKSPGFVQSPDGVTFTLPPTVFRPSKAPATVTQASALRLIVPELFPLVSCRIQFEGSQANEARNAEAAFEARAASQEAGTLLAQVNYLSQNLKQMATTPKPQPVSQAPQATISKEQPPVDAPPSETTATEKPHVHIIPKPLEWMQPPDEHDDTSSDSYSDFEDTYSETDEADEEQTPARATTSVAERGILLSFPNLELHGIELLELTSLSMTVKCNRCKEVSDFERLRNNTNADHTGM